MYISILPCAGSKLSDALRIMDAVGAIRSERHRKVRAWPRPRWPHEPRMQYFKVLLWFVERVQYVVRTELMPKLPEIIEAHAVTRPANERVDAAGRDIDEAFENVSDEALRAIPDNVIEMQAQKHALRVTQWHGRELERQIRHVIKVDVLDNSALASHLEVAVAENVALIKNLAFGQLEDLKGIVTRGARHGVHHTVIAQQFVDRFAFPKKRAALIATDQVGKLNSELNQIRQQNLGVRRYRWSSSQGRTGARFAPVRSRSGRSHQSWTTAPASGDIQASRYAAGTSRSRSSTTCWLMPG